MDDWKSIFNGVCTDSDFTTANSLTYNTNTQTMYVKPTTANYATIGSSWPSTTTTTPYVSSNGQDYSWWLDNNYTSPKKWEGYTEVFKVISKTKVFAGIPKWRYVVQFDELPNDGKYLNNGWPWIVEGCNDWIFINLCPDQNLKFVEFEVPLHVKISENDRIAPLNQYENKFENTDIIELVNRKK